MVSRTRLNLRRLYLYLVLVFTFVFNLLNKLHTIIRIIDVFHWVYKPSIFNIFVQIFQIICSRRKIIYTFYLFGDKTERNEVLQQKHWKFNIAFKDIYFFSRIYDNRPWHFLRCRFLSYLVEILLAIFWAVFTGFSRFYASPRICSSFRNRKEPMAHFQNAFFFVFWLFSWWQWFWKHF